MTAHPITDTAVHNRPVYSVGEISQALKRHIEGTFDNIRVRGEITGCKRHTSGHVYFALKDADAVLDAVSWRGAAFLPPIQPGNGIEVIATGRLTTFAGRSKYQMIVDRLELAGRGALLKLLEDRKRRLAEEGLFDAARKRPLPYLPEIIGVVTSPTGAVIRDILHRLNDRFPRHVLLWPVAVQGIGAAEQVAAAIAGFNGLLADGPVPRPDVLIVARGGGSLEDLWAFNEEAVVRAVAAGTIPLIAAVGHETDTTLIDFAADRRAPTPTAAAEMAVPVRLDLAERAMTLATRHSQAFRRQLATGRTRVDAAARGLPKPARLLDDARGRLDDRAERLTSSLGVTLDRHRTRLAHVSARMVSPVERIGRERDRLAAETRALERAVASSLQRATDGLGRIPPLALVIARTLKDEQTALAHVAALLEGFSYQRVLDRGFALVHDRFGKLITSVTMLRTGMTLGLRFADGERRATVERDPGERSEERSAGPGKKGQGSLF
jgi:exodeoxyribonuclease VII large subunit